MKYTFTAALIFAFAKAQEEQVDTPCPFLENLITTNELGQKELDLQIPEIAFTDVDESVIEDWTTTKEQSYRELDQKLSDAWTNYVDAIAEPWNDLMSKAESLATQRDQLNAVTADEAITFVAENTFIDGKSLKSLFPQIESVLTTLESEADTIEGRFNLDAFKITPRTLQRQEIEVAETEEPEEPQTEESQDEDKDEGSDSDSDSSSSSSESEADEAEIREEALEKIEDAIITYGYDPQVVAEWFKNKSTSWEELIREQEMHNAVQAQADMAEAAEKVEDMLDSIVEELSAMDLETKADYEEALIAKIDELKALVGSRFDEQLTNIQDWINEKQATQEEEPTESIEEELDEQATLMDLEEEIAPVSEDATETTEDTVVEDAVAEDAIAFASKHVKTVKQEESTSYFGYAGVSVGVVGVLAYMFGKKKTTVKALEQTTTDADEEFQLV